MNERGNDSNKNDDILERTRQGSVFLLGFQDECWRENYHVAVPQTPDAVGEGDDEVSHGPTNL